MSCKSIMGHKGKEVINMVNVQALKGKCLALNDGGAFPTVEELVEMQTRSEFFARTASQSTLDSHTDYVARNKDIRALQSRSPIHLRQMALVRSQQWDERLDRVVAQKKIVEDEKLAYRMSMCRSQPNPPKERLNTDELEEYIAQWAERRSSVHQGEIYPRQSSFPGVHSDSVRRTTQGSSGLSPLGLAEL